MNAEPGAPARRGLLFDGLCLAVLWALCYLPGLGLPELDHEEGRRLLPAAAMLESGDWIVPRIWGRAYLSKPPLHYWMIAGVSAIAGGVDAWTTRLPSALSVLGVALVLLAVADRELGRRAARIAALTWLALPLAFEKGTLGELEASLALWTTLALAGQHAAARAGGGGAAAVQGGRIALGLAVLAKGPAAWVFTASAAVGCAAVERGRARAHLRAGLAAVAVSALVAGVWAALLAARLEPGALASAWGDQLVGGERGLGRWLSDRAGAISGGFAGMLPASAVALALAPRAARRGGLPPLVRFALAVAVGSALFFLVYPRSKARYLLPAAPWVALAAGYALDRGLAAAQGDGLRRVARATALALGAAGAALGLGVLLDRFGVDLAPHRPDALGVVLGAALAAVGALALSLARRGSPERALWLALAVLPLAKVLHGTQLVRHDAAPHGLANRAAEIDAALPSGARVHTAHWGEFNLLAYLPRPLAYTADPARDVLPGDVLLYAVRGAETPPADAAAWPELGRWPLEKGRTLHAVRRPARRAE